MRFRFVDISSLLCVLMAGLSLTSCHGRIGDWYDVFRLLNADVEIPEHFLKVENGQFSDVTFKQDGPVFVIYYGPDNCTQCSVNKMWQNECIYKASEDGRMYLPMTVFAPEYGELEELLQTIQSTDIEHPVFIDVDREFEKQGFMPDNPQLRLFLVNDDGQVVYFGLPDTDDYTRKTFTKTLDSFKK